MKISLIIPMYNESSIVADTLKQVSEYMNRTFSDWEVLFSDDGSTDGCRKTVDEFPDERIRSVGYEVNQGKGAAVRNGMLNASGDLMIFTDCDLAYGLDVLKTMVGYFEKNPTAGMVIGSRNLSDDGYEGYTFLRKVASKTYLKVLGIMAGFKLSDSQCGIKGFTKETVQAIFPSCEENRFAFDFEILLKAKNLGIQIVEMPVKVINHRESKVHLVRDSLRMMKALRQIKKRNKV